MEQPFPRIHFLVPLTYRERGSYLFQKYQPVSEVTARDTSCCLTSPPSVLYPGKSNSRRSICYSSPSTPAQRSQRPDSASASALCGLAPSRGGELLEVLCKVTTDPRLQVARNGIIHYKCMHSLNSSHSPHMPLPTANTLCNSLSHLNARVRVRDALRVSELPPLV